MRWNGPAFRSRLDVPATPWDKLVDYYCPKEGTRDWTRPMHALVERIAAAWWSRGLFARTSMASLIIAQTDPFDIFGRQVLVVEPGPARTIVFRYDGWETNAPEGDAFEKLEHVLRNRLKWVAGHT